ncbi:uncharacterized protein SCHCODRAFT_02661334 [Schizophyllum commune H4-8]|nr:uncharacterized protein SCHCODRAFT_02661334 [Schizophyllum commune H4-8]KAI5899733.1 hypothetical protein SCHCODRAFT_02661334 [Schizophyllum commune H4-8]
MGTSTSPRAQVEDATVQSPSPNVGDGDERGGGNVADNVGDVALDPRYRHPNAFILFRQSFLKGSKATWVEPKGKDIHKVIGEYAIMFARIWAGIPSAQHWKALPEEERERFRAQAAQNKQTAQLPNPEKRRRRKRQQLSAVVATKPQEEVSCSSMALPSVPVIPTPPPMDPLPNPRPIISLRKTSHPKSRSLGTHAPYASPTIIHSPPTVQIPAYEDNPYRYSFPQKPRPSKPRSTAKDGRARTAEATPPPHQDVFSPARAIYSFSVPLRTPSAEPLMAAAPGGRSSQTTSEAVFLQDFPRRRSLSSPETLRPFSSGRADDITGHGNVPSNAPCVGMMNQPYYPASTLSEEADSSAPSSWSPTRSDFIVGAHRRGVHSWNVPWASQPVDQTPAALMGLEPAFAPGPSAYQYAIYDAAQYAQAPAFLNESQWAAAPATYPGVDSAPDPQQSYIQWPQQEQAVDYTAAGPTAQPAAGFAQYAQYPMQQQESYDNSYYAPYAYDATEYN